MSGIFVPCYTAYGPQIIINTDIFQNLLFYMKMENVHEFGIVAEKMNT